MKPTQGKLALYSQIAIDMEAIIIGICVNNVLPVNEY